MDVQWPAFGPSWTLFLDRDGVINRRLPGAYVRTWAEFEWLPGALPAIASFGRLFGRVVVVTNQQGIGKGLMTEAALHRIHRQMLAGVEAFGGRIDGVYHCPALALEQPNCRKPGPAMALQARQDFPGIDFRRSVMVGDSWSDMEFGQRLGMFNVLVVNKEEEQSALIHAREQGIRADAAVDGLAGLAAAWSS